MSLPTDYPNGLLVPGVIVSRGDKKNDPGGTPDQSQAGMVQVALIGRHNFPSQVPLSHLPLSTITKPPTGGAQDTIEPAPDKGTTVMCYHQTGRADVVVAGQFSDTNESSSSTPGNINLMMSMFGQIMRQHGGQRIAPDWIEKIVDGAKIREKVEKGMYHSHSLLAGLPTHGAILPLLKTLPPVTQIPTAIQEFSKILNSDMASKMPGMPASIGSIFSMIKSDPNKLAQVTQNMPPHVKEAFESISTLAQNGTTMEAGGDTTGLRVDPSTFANNAADLLSQVRTVDDLVNATHRLLYDTSLHGTEKLANTSFTFEGPYGNTELILTPSGEIDEKEDEETKKKREQFENSMSSGSGAPSGSAGGGSSNMFGQSAQTMMQMFKRLSPEAQKAAQQLLQRVNQRSLNQKTVDPSKMAILGQNPIQDAEIT